MYDVNSVENPNRMWVINEDLEDEKEPMERVSRETEKIFRTISTLHRCETNDAKKLCIFDSFYKLNSESNYNIGGCYTTNQPDLWFYYTTTVCLEQVYMINLFVCHRRTGTFALGISNSNELSYQTVDDTKTATLPDSLTWYRFLSSQKDQNHYIKTFNINGQEKNSLQNTVLYIPVSVKMEPTFFLGSDLIESIKLEHNTKNITSLQKETDFVFISADGSKYPVHKVIVAAHSTVLRELMKGSSSSLVLDESDSEIEFIIQYMYTGVIKDISNHEIFQLLEIVHKYELTPLCNLMKGLIGKQIDVNNAVDVAIVAKKFNLQELLDKVFKFIKKNPKVINTEGWLKLNDVELAKSLFKHCQNKDDDF